jgi:hypothetical protein
MTKRQFIWLVIRFIGFAYLFAAVPAVLIVGNCLWLLTQADPSNQVSNYFTSYYLIDQIASGTSTILITAYLLFGGSFIHRVVDKSTSFVAEEGLDTRNYAEIMVRFIGVYFLWGVFARLCVTLYSAIMLTRFHNAPKEYADLVSKNEMLTKYFTTLEKSMNRDILIGVIILAGLAFYFLKRGRFVIDLFHHRWLPGETQTSVETQLPPE